MLRAMVAMCFEVGHARRGQQCAASGGPASPQSGRASAHPRAKTHCGAPSASEDCGETTGFDTEVNVANEDDGGRSRSAGMSVREAGKLGGEARKSQLGQSGYSQMGK